MTYKKVPYNATVETTTPTITGGAAVVSSSQKHYVDSDGILHCNGYIAFSGAGSATQVLITLPAGLEIDTARLASETSTANDVAVVIQGVFEWFDSGAAYKMLGAFYASATQIGLHENPGLLLASSFASGDGLKWNYSIPVK